MPTIEFSNVWMQGFGQRVFRVNDSSTGASLHNCGYLTTANASPNAMGRIVIMQGTIPSDFSTLTSYNARSSDALIIFNQVWNFPIFHAPAATNPLVLTTTTNPTASASGTATWFWLLNYDQAVGGSAPILQQAFGTVGLRGSGADLEISDTNIVSGQTYRINSLKINFPSTYTY